MSRRNSGTSRAAQEEMTSLPPCAILLLELQSNGLAQGPTTLRRNAHSLGIETVSRMYHQERSSADTL